jgi:hypothetical protein
MILSGSAVHVKVRRRARQDGRSPVSDRSYIGRRPLGSRPVKFPSFYFCVVFRTDVGIKSALVFDGERV